VPARPIGMLSLYRNRSDEWRRVKQDLTEEIEELERALAQRALRIDSVATN
jgi:hypothetical protein